MKSDYKCVQEIVPVGLRALGPYLCLFQRSRQPSPARPPGQTNQLKPSTPRGTQKQAAGKGGAWRAKSCFHLLWVS